VVLTAIAIYRRVPGAMLLAKAEFSTRRWLGMALNFAMSTGALAAIQQIDVLMLGMLRPIEEVGIYRVAGQGALVVGCAAAALGPVAAMRFIDAIARDAERRIVQDIRLFRLAGLALIVPPLVVLLALGDAIIPWVFGPAFAASVTPMIILSAPLVSGTLTSPIAGYQSHSGAHGAIARFFLAGAAANLPLNAMLIPTLGVNGAAMATAASLLLVQLLVWRRWMGLPISKVVG
jgi:O-antigen/teichoic acid export membrane protein